MTAEEVALDQFRSAVTLTRVARRSGRDSLGHLTAVHMLARIIRAIRTERTPFHAMEKRLAGSIEGGIEAGIALIKARAYEQGRRDALRGVQGACLYEEAASDDHSPDYYIALSVIADAAEEAAR